MCAAAEKDGGHLKSGRAEAFSGQQDEGSETMQDADEAFSEYLETYEADEIFNSHFSAVRRAFLAGFKAAGGTVAKAQPIFKIVKTTPPPK